MKLPEELQFFQNSISPQKTTQARMDGKTCVISGATSGIGYETARRLSKGGAHVIMLCRNEDKAIQVQKQLADEFRGTSDFFIADFQKLSEVKIAATEISQQYPRIDVLINNAGVFNRRRRLTADGNEMTIGIIHLASFLLTQLLIGNLKNTAPARVLFINSEAHRFGGLSVKDMNWKHRPYIGMLAYGAAKIAQIHTAMMLSEKYRDDKITFNLVHPGEVRTNIGMNNGIFYRLYKNYLLNRFLKDPVISAESIYYMAADPSLENITGKFFNMTIEEKPAWYAVNPKDRQPLWDKSMDLIEPYLKEER